MFSKYHYLLLALFITLTPFPLFQASNQEQPDSSSIQQQKSSGFRAKVVAVTGWTLATALGITTVWYYKQDEANTDQLYHELDTNLEEAVDYL